MDNEILQLDGQRGISQEALEDLRSEFLSIGGVVKSLPDVKSVRDNTIVMIRDTSYKVEVYDRWQMINNKWYWIGKAVPENPFNITGEVYQKNTGTTIAVASINTLYNITSGWTYDLVEHIHYNQAGLFQIEHGGEYLVIWSLSLLSAGTNKEYEAGIVLNGSEFTSGWSHEKLAVANDTLSMSSSAILNLKTGDKINLGIICRTSPVADVDIEHANFLVMKRGL